MAILLIVDDESESIGRSLNSNTLYVTSHQSLNEANHDLTTKQFDYALIHYDPSITDASSVSTPLVRLQPDLKIIWLVDKEVMDSFKNSPSYKDEVYLVKPFSQQEVIDLVGKELIDQSQVDLLFAKKSK